MSIFIVLTEEYFGGDPKKVKAFSSQLQANEYGKQLGKECNLEIVIVQTTLDQPDVKNYDYGTNEGSDSDEVDNTVSN